MPTLVPSSVNEHLVSVRATAVKYFKGESDMTIRRRWLLSFLEKHGNIAYNVGGHSFTKNFEIYQPEVRPYGDSGDQEFNTHNADEQLTFDVRGYTVTDRLSKKVALANRGKEAIVNLYDGKTKKLAKAMRNKFNGEFFVDGYLAANADRLIGLESCMGAGSCAAGDIVAKNNDTYGGASTVQGAFGGNWSAELASGDRPNATLANDWPYGHGDSQYDPFSALLVNYTSTGFSSGSATWIDNCEEVLRLASIVCANKSGDDSVPMVHMLDAKMYADFLNFYAARNRILVPHKESQDLGFSKTMNLDGAAVKFEFDVPGGVGYGINIEEFELLCSQEQLFVPDGPEWSMSKKSYLYEVGFFGNLLLNPKNLAKYAAIA